MGAFTNQGLFWIKSNGKLVPVDKQFSHEEFAQVKWNLDLETCFQRGYIRIQSIPGQYLFVDHRSREVSHLQSTVLEDFFHKIYKTIVISRTDTDHTEFSGGDATKAFQYCVDGSSSDADSAQSSNEFTSSNASKMYMRDMETQMLNPYYRNRSFQFGDHALNNFSRFFYAD
jgi:hypothetical protein